MACKCGGNLGDMWAVSYAPIAGPQAPMVGPLANNTVTQPTIPPPQPSLLLPWAFYGPASLRSVQPAPPAAPLLATTPVFSSPLTQQPPSLIDSPFFALSNLAPKQTAAPMAVMPGNWNAATAVPFPSGMDMNQSFTSSPSGLPVAIPVTYLPASSTAQLQQASVSQAGVAQASVVGTGGPGLMDGSDPLSQSFANSPIMPNAGVCPAGTGMQGSACVPISGAAGTPGGPVLSGSGAYQPIGSDGSFAPLFSPSTADTVRHALSQVPWYVWAMAAWKVLS